MTIVEDMLRWVSGAARPLRDLAALPGPAAEFLHADRASPLAEADPPAALARFLRRQWNDDGGFAGRGGGSDLYYTVFGLQAMAGLGAEIPLHRVREFLAGFGIGENLDLVHLGCLMRAWWLESSLSGASFGAATRRAMLAQLDAFRSADGGFALLRGESSSSVYATFLAVAACQDASVPLPQPERAARAVWAMQASDGGFANDADFAVPTTPSTAAALATLRHLGQTPPESAVQWLLGQACPEGGFYAFDGAPEPDLLSTATALHAVETANLPAHAQTAVDAKLDALADANRRFLSQLWTPAGGFRGSQSDDQPDVEYTFYGLLALGHLA